MKKGSFRAARSRLAFMRMLLSIFFGMLSLLACKVNGYAQLCTGSLGDPVINITFGSGANPGPPRDGDHTSYIYTTGCPGDGYYSILNSASCNAWHHLASDHTPGDQNGYMMLVNASYSPGVFFMQTVSGLCENTVYEFAAWILNFNTSGECGGTPIQPNITFSIETTGGTVLKSYQSGDIPVTGSPEWKQYGFYFSTPTGVSDIVIRMVNNAPGGCGNDLALDDITFRPCGPLVTTTINGEFREINICEEEPAVFELKGRVAGSASDVYYQWQESLDKGASWTDISGASSPVYSRLSGAPGEYRYRLTVSSGSNLSNSACRVSSDIATVYVNPQPVPDPANNSPLCEGEDLQLRAGEGAEFSWTGPENFTSDLSSPLIAGARKSREGVYRVKVISAKGCEAEGETEVVVHERPVAGAGNDTTICAGSPALLRGSGIAAAEFRWQPVSGLSSFRSANTLASPKDTTRYYLIVTSSEGCTDTADLRVNVLPLPSAAAGNDAKIFSGQSVALNGRTGDGDYRYRWTPDYKISDPFVLSPVVSPEESTHYVLAVESGMGCGTATDTVWVRVLKAVKVPNAFSPNGDGINDYWNIEALNTYPEADIRVFNRDGRIVYSGRGYSTPWNGTFNGRPVPAGTYYYRIDCKNGLPLLSGWVFLVR